MTVTFFWNTTPCNTAWKTDDQGIWRHNMEDQHLHIYRQENLRSRKLWRPFHVPMHAACLATPQFTCTVYDQKQHAMQSTVNVRGPNLTSLTLCAVFSMYGFVFANDSRSQLLRGLRRGSAAARLLWLWFRIPPGAWSFVSCECCVLSGRGFCDGLITCPEEFYRVWCVQWVWSRSSIRGRQDPKFSQSAKGIKKSPNNKEWSLPSKKNVLSSHIWKKVCLLWGRNWFYIAFTQFVICLNSIWLYRHLT